MQHCTVLGIQQEPVGKTQRIVSVLLQQSIDGIMNDDNDFEKPGRWASIRLIEDDGVMLRPGQLDINNNICLTLCGKS